MNRRLYTATGTAITAVRTLLRADLHVTGAETLPDRPILFAVNHFTRLETLLIPYVVARETGRMVHSLAMPSLFSGLLGKYLSAVGVISTRDPRRNRTIVGDLMTGRGDWVIYPEGRLVKNKKTVHKGRLRLDHPKRQGPPHTGAALLALRSEVAKRRYLDVCERPDVRRREFYEQRYGLEGPGDLSPHSAVVVPVNFTFHPLRPAPNLISRLVTRLKPDLNPAVNEELLFESSLLMGHCQVSVHFSEALDVSEYLGRTRELARRVVGMFSEQKTINLFLRRQAHRLTEDCMRRIYRTAQITFDHLFCCGLRALPTERIPTADLHEAIYLAAVHLRSVEGMRLHPELTRGLDRLLSKTAFPPLASVVQLAERQGVLRRDHDCYIVDRDKLLVPHAFESVRVENTVQVIANELEPIEEAVESVRRLVTMSPRRRSELLSKTLRQADADSFLREYSVWKSDDSHATDVGEPYLLGGRAGAPGVVLVHGYLSTPAQMRELAEHLHGRGLQVYSVRLAGHGTTPQHLTEVGWRDWIESIHQGHAILRPRCDRIVVGGFSLGGTLAMLVAADDRSPVDAAFTVNAPLRVRDPRTPLVPAIVEIHGAMRRLGLSDGYIEQCNAETENPETNYRRHYLTSVRELRRSMNACRKRLRGVTVPTLIIQGDEDPIVDPESGRMLQGLLGERSELVVMPFERHNVVTGAGSRAVFERIAAFIERSLASLS